MSQATHLDDLLLKWEERLEQGENVTPEDLCRDAPELLEALKKGIQALKLISSALDVTHVTSTGPYEKSGRSLDGIPEIAGYEVLGELGHGGMGVVYKARQIGLNRVVALKLVLGGAHASAEQLRRFRLEAEAAARLQHPNIVQVYEVGESAGLPHFSMEHVEGGTLAHRIKDKPLPPRDAAEMLEALARAAHAAHQKGVVHRDLKPGNVLLTREGVPKITDFGLARCLETEKGQTKTGWVMGTPAYMAPEQAEGRTKEAGPPADVYALGAILYAMLTGRPPFDGESDIDTLRAVISTEPIPPSHRGHAVPRDLETISLKCLSKLPRDRYGSAEALADDLRRFLQGNPIHARRTPLWERGLKWVRRRPRAAAGMGTLLAMLLLAALAGVWYWDGNYRVKIDYYAQFARRWGAYEGVGRLTEEQTQHRGVTYKFFSRAGQVERLEVVNGCGQLSTRPIITPLLETADATPTTAACRIEFRRNDQGAITEEIAHDQTGEVVWRFHYTTPTRGHYTDRSGLPRTRTRSGAAYLEFVYSPDGLEREIWFLDRDGERKPNAGGVCGIRYEFDAQGLAVGEIYLDVQGAPTTHRDGYGAVQSTRDGLGEAIEERYLDRMGQPTLNLQGYARATILRDPHGNLLQTAYYGLDNRPCLSKGGYAGMRQSHDEHGSPTEEAYLGLHGELVLHRLEGYAAVQMVYDARGDSTRWTFLGTDGTPCLGAYGFAGLGWVHDQHRRVKEVTTLGIDGASIRGPAGYATMATAYDARSHVTEEAYLDTDRKPVQIILGFARLTRKFDDRGNKIEEAYWDEASQPVLISAGFARVTTRYDSHNNPVETTYYGADGRTKPCGDGYAILRQGYSEDGHLTQEAYFDAASQPVLNKFGYARVNHTYDQRGNLLETSYLDREGRAVVRKDLGYARARWTYDDKHTRVTAAYAGSDGQPVKVRPVVRRVQAGSLPLKRGDLLMTYDDREISNGVEFLASLRQDGQRDPRPRKLGIIRMKGDIKEPLVVLLTPGDHAVELVVELEDIAITGSGQ